jgi:hypothetical protein
MTNSASGRGKSSKGVDCKEQVLSVLENTLKKDEKSHCLNE